MGILWYSYRSSNWCGWLAVGAQVAARTLTNRDAAFILSRGTPGAVDVTAVSAMIARRYEFTET